jgi:hypothetical protein
MPTQLPASYDAWRLAAPDDDFDSIGVEEGGICNRLPEPDEDAPRNWRPRPCSGEMVNDDGDGVICDTCGAVV